MSFSQTNLKFRSSSEFLQKKNVQTAIYGNLDIAQIAHQFDELHLTAEQSPSVKTLKCQKKKELMQAIEDYENTSELAVA